MSTPERRGAFKCSLEVLWSGMAVSLLLMWRVRRQWSMIIAFIYFAIMAMLFSAGWL